MDTPAHAPTRRRAAALLLAALATLAAGCASRPDVRTDHDPAVDLASYKTFSFAPTHDASPYEALLAARLQSATRAQLERAHYVYSEQAPDLRVNLRLAVADRIEWRSAPSRVGWRSGPSGHVDSRDYRQGWLTIDLVDTKRNALVWHGVAEGRLDARTLEQPGAAIEAAVGEIFARWPGVRP